VGAALQPPVAQSLSGRGVLDRVVDDVQLVAIAAIASYFVWTAWKIKRP